MILYKDSKVCKVSLNRNRNTKFRSVYTYQGDIKRYMSDHGGSIAGYRGAVGVDTIFIDIDRGSYTLGSAKEDTIDIFQSLIDRGIPPKSLAIFFSGSKGFHIHIHGSIAKDLGFSEYTPRKVLNLVRGLVPSEGSGVDFTIYTPNSVIRLPNSVHEKSGKYKIYLTFSEINVMLCSEIVELANKPRRIPELEEIKDVEISIPDFFAPRPKSKTLYITKSIRPCIKKMKQGGIPKGKRDIVLTALVSHMLNVEGNTPEMVYAALAGPWLKSIKGETKLTPGYIRRKIERAPSYSYGCNSDIMRFFCGGECQVKKCKY